jgi:methylglyoxal synthase
MATISLIAHDGKKDTLIEWATLNRAALSQFKIIATGTTGGRLQREVGLDVTRMLSGPLGGDLQIGAMVATGDILAVFFFRDPLTPHPHEPDISALMKVCDTHNVALATNVATADLLLEGLIK